MKFTVGCYGPYTFLLLSVIQPDFLLSTVTYEITVNCYNTFWILNETRKIEN